MQDVRDILAQIYIILVEVFSHFLPLLKYMEEVVMYVQKFTENLCSILIACLKWLTFLKCFFHRVVHVL